MRRTSSIAKWLLISMSFWCVSTSAAVWTIDPGLELLGTYTDNIELAAPGIEEYEFVMTLFSGLRT